jgi:predicted RNase H-like HicB family nuclease
MEYTVIFHQAEEGGFWAEVPALPGCYSQGESIEETVKNIREAIEAHIEALKEEGQDIPEEGEFVIGKIKVALAS